MLKYAICACAAITRRGWMARECHPRRHSQGSASRPKSTPSRLVKWSLRVGPPASEKDQNDSISNEGQSSFWRWWTRLSQRSLSIRLSYNAQMYYVYTYAPMLRMYLAIHLHTRTCIHMNTYMHAAFQCEPALFQPPCQRF